MLSFGFLIYKNIAGNIEHFYNINETVADPVIKLRYILKVVHAYAPTSSHDNQLIENFYEYMGSAMTKVKNQYYSWKTSTPR